MDLVPYGITGKLHRNALLKVQGERSSTLAHPTGSVLCRISPSARIVQAQTVLGRSLHF